MKYLYILSVCTLALCLTSNLGAQENTASQNDKKVIVIKKTVDSDGAVTVEKIITTGEEGREVIVTVDEKGVHKVEGLEGETDGNTFWISSDDSEDVSIRNIEVTVDSGEEGEAVWVSSGDADEVIVKNIEVNVDENDERKVITIVSDGETEVIELMPGAEMSQEKKEELFSRGIHIIGDHTDADHEGVRGMFFSENGSGISEKIHLITEKLTNFDFNFDFDSDMNFARVGHNGANCIALGVFVNTDKSGGVKIQSIIDGSGAQDAGLESGDIIHGIGEDPVESYSALHKALSNYEPGEIVTVKYEREGVVKSVEAELRAWGDLPKYENSWRAQVKCGDTEFKGEYDFIGTPKVNKRIIIIKKGESTPPVIEEEVVRDPVASVHSNMDYSLNLENFTAFPNPTDGKFKVAFEADSKPLTVSVFDATGKEIYRDNVKNFDGYYEKEIDLRGMSRGALILSVAQEGKRHSEQIMLQ